MDKKRNTHTMTYIFYSHSRIHSFSHFSHKMVKINANGTHATYSGRYTVCMQTHSIRYLLLHICFFFFLPPFSLLPVHNATVHTAYTIRMSMSIRCTVHSMYRYCLCCDLTIFSFFSLHLPVHCTACNTTCWKCTAIEII